MAKEFEANYKGTGVDIFKMNTLEILIIKENSIDMPVGNLDIQSTLEGIRIIEKQIDLPEVDLNTQ